MSVDAIRAEGRSEAEREIAEARSEAEKARLEAVCSAIRDVCGVLDLPLSPEREAALAAMDGAGLSALRARLVRERRWE